MYATLTDTGWGIPQVTQHLEVGGLPADLKRGLRGQVTSVVNWLDDLSRSSKADVRRNLESLINGKSAHLAPIFSEICCEDWSPQRVRTACQQICDRLNGRA